MKILILSHQFYPQVGGIEINSEIIAETIKSFGDDVRVVTWSVDTDGKVFPFPIIRNPSLLMLFNAHKWADVILENNPCLRMSWPNLIVRRPLVIVINTWVSRVDGSLGLQDKIKLKWLSRASKVIAVSEAIKDATFNDAVVIGNPYRSDKFKILKNIERERDFVFLGRLVSDKGADMAIKAIDNINKSHPKPQKRKITLTIIGDGPELENLKSLSKALRVEDQVAFTGSLSGENLMTALNDHKFMVVPSIWKEPFGNVVLEGMACGCIPIVSDGGGLPDAVGKAGLVFSRASLDSLVEAMSTLIFDDNAVEDFKSKAYHHLLNHRPDVACRKYLKVMSEAIDKLSSFVIKTENYDVNELRHKIMK